MSSAKILVGGMYIQANFLGGGGANNIWEGRSPFC